MVAFSPTKTKIIVNLARYKFLTMSQMLRLGVATQKSNINKNLLDLRRGKNALVDSIDFPFVAGHGRGESMFFLKPKAKELLVEELRMEADFIKIPKGNTITFSSDYWHRKYTINSMLDLDLNASEEGSQILWFDYYFDKLTAKGKGQRAKNKINLIGESYLIPDGIFVKELADQSKELWLFELFNDKEARRPYETLLKHREALMMGSASEKYGFDRANRVLSVFTKKNVYEAVLKKFESDTQFDNFRPLFFFELKEH